MASPRRSTVPLHPVIDVIGRWNHCMAFLAIAFAWSWSCWLLTPSLGARFTVAAGVMTALGSFGPGRAAVTLIGWVGGGRGLRAWFGRCLQWRVGVRPFVLAVFLPLAVLAPAALVHAALGGRPGTSPVAGHLPMAAANVALILLLGGPTGEEFGWRGYAWPALRAWHGWRASSLILGAVWGLWHLPLFFIAGTLQSRLPLLPFLVSGLPPAPLRPSVASVKIRGCFLQAASAKAPRHEGATVGDELSAWCPGALVVKISTSSTSFRPASPAPRARMRAHRRDA